MAKDVTIGASIAFEKSIASRQRRLVNTPLYPAGAWGGGLSDPAKNVELAAVPLTRK
jgi:hypothetical protein